MKQLKVFFLSLLLLASGAAQARTPVPVIEHQAVPVTAGSGKSLSAEEVCQAARSAAVSRNWSISHQKEAGMTAAYSWNGNKHTIMVNITCSPDSYSLTYRDSINMKYRMVEGVPNIHPHYNRFVGELKQAIQNNLQNL